LGHKDGKDTRTEVYGTSADRHQAEKLLPEERFAVVFPGARFEIKQWPRRNFAEAISRVSQQDHIHWLVCGGEREQRLANALVEDLSLRSVSASSVAGKTTLRELAVLMQHALLFFGNDTGPAHIAAAVGTPSVCVVGGGLPGVCFPYPGRVDTVAVRNELPCYKCYWNCIRSEPECITRVEISAVVQALEAVLSSRLEERTRENRV
jgi:ADP-heptose:LPS heptosyltransferase